MLNKRHLFIISYSAFLFKILFPYIKERKCPFRGSVQTKEQRTFFIIKIARKCAIWEEHIMLGILLFKKKDVKFFYFPRLKAGVGYKRKNKPQFWQFLFCTQSVKISKSSWGLSLIWLACLFNYENDWQLSSARWPSGFWYGVFVITIN